MTSTKWIKDMLEKRGVAYESLHHRVAFTAQEVAQLEHISGESLAKVVVVITDGRPVELILPASRRVVLERVRKLLGAMRFASPRRPRSSESSPIAKRVRSPRCVIGKKSRY